MKIEVDYTLLRKLVDYNWDAEEKHFEESLEDELPYSEAQEPDHIFHVIKKKFHHNHLYFHSLVLTTHLI